MIKLLNQKEFKKDYILKQMYDDNYYYNVLGKLALSSSSMKLLLDSPKKYAYVSEYGSPETQALRDGSLVHLAILEPKKFQEQIFVDVASKNTKTYKEAVAKYGQVFTRVEKENAEKIADTIFRNEQAMQLITNCEFEVPAIGDIYGYPFRGKADVLSKKGIVDLKTTSGGIKNFYHSAKKYLYSVQCYIYCQLFNVSYKQFKFLVIDKGSLDIGIFECSEEFYKDGEQLTKKAIDIYETFFVNGADLDDYVITGIL
jgi:hypothetical protein|tara:strand:- start:653 stop:1423 length:771 start_codon:yes stop_codon:yes gene_type:complete